MAFLFNKFQEAVRTLARSPTFSRDPRKMQFEADINRLFLFTCYNRLGRNAEEAEVEEIIEMASKASVADQQKQVQENVHYQIENFCKAMDDILLYDMKKICEQGDAPAAAARPSGLSFAVGKSGPSNSVATIPETRPLKTTEVSEKLKNSIGFSLDLKPSQIPHKDAGRGLFVNGEADIGTIIAIYPGVIYTPAHYQYIPGYPRVDAQNTYLITRYDGTIINAQPWGTGGETREPWNGLTAPETKPDAQNTGSGSGSDRFWKILSKPLEGKSVGRNAEILERRNPLALAHFANHPANGMLPNVMVCPYDFPLTEKGMRAYIPNIAFGDSEVTMRRFGSFWFKSRPKGNNGVEIPVLKSLVLVANRALSDEEVLLNYRLSNSKRRPEWYSPVDEEEDKRRWS